MKSMTKTADKSYTEKDYKKMDELVKRIKKEWKTDPEYRKAVKKFIKLTT